MSRNVRPSKFARRNSGVFDPSERFRFSVPDSPEPGSARQERVEPTGVEEDQRVPLLVHHRRSFVPVEVAVVRFQHRLLVEERERDGAPPSFVVVVRRRLSNLVGYAHVGTSVRRASRSVRYVESAYAIHA
ncbi:hypothetical protein A4G99_20225 [Haladaptatus sp. R4]|uniref:hypothetical protein n=1 Tax=Haladaptatus sp. R4 TaxID=1679489 RepID=UPI0007B478A4|nr:hypothetical protein [Haladaptatus sp. R4]KZN22515.1 hypothetical protein A4G99_20225 [Haladaptatus sp. R4]